MAVYSDQQAAEYYNQLPRKRVGAGILLFNRRDELLIVKPNYLEKWLWIGGVSEENESPQATALRECKEEIGITPASVRLAFVNYQPQLPTGQSEALNFMFTSDPVEDDFIDTLTLQASEIEDARFVPVSELAEYLHGFRARAIQTYWKNKHTHKASILYLENGYAS